VAVSSRLGAICLQVTINVRSEKVVTHGLYLMVYGEEAFRAYDSARNVRLPPITMMSAAD
jgi:hypothetical protein